MQLGSFGLPRYQWRLHPQRQQRDQTSRSLLEILSPSEWLVGRHLNGLYKASTLPQVQQFALLIVGYTNAFEDQHMYLLPL